MIYKQAIMIVAMIATWIPVAALVIRGRSRRVVTVATILTAGAVSLHLWTLLRLFEEGSAATLGRSVYTVVASVLPMLLSGYALSLVLARSDPEESFQASRRSLITIGLAGIAMLALIHKRQFIAGYDWSDDKGTIRIGPLGKAYLSYLLIGLVAIGYNLEKSYRIASAEARYRIRLPLLGCFGVIGFATFILSTGMLYGALGTGKMIAFALPLGAGALAIAYGYLRGAVTDVGAPVSRNIVYSSFSALAAALFVLAIGLAAQIATVTRWSPDEILVVTCAFLVVLVATLFIFSNRFQRSVRRFIDRNFYVNRYDYRTQWSKLTQSLDNATDQDGVLDRVAPFLLDVFSAHAITVALRDEASREIRPILGKGADLPSEVLESGTPLHLTLGRDRKALLLDRKSDDFTYIPIYAENDRWLANTASRMVAPLMDGSELVGTIGLERRDEEDPFTFEDVALLDSIAAHIAASLRSVTLARQLSDTKEMELISQWSSMLLHDLKNYLAPLRMTVSNLMEYRNVPETVVVCAEDIGNVTSRMEKLVSALAHLRQNPQLGMEAMCPNEIVNDALSAIQVARKSTIRVDLSLEAKTVVYGDRGMLRRVLENLITNAIDAMDGVGTLTIRTMGHRSNGSSQVWIEVADTGRGIQEKFLRSQLFKPFATTKEKGLGLGLYQCRTIVQAHGGELCVKSEVGKGSVFRIALRAGSPKIAIEGDDGLRAGNSEAVG